VRDHRIDRVDGLIDDVERALRVDGVAARVLPGVVIALACVP